MSQHSPDYGFLIYWTLPTAEVSFMVSEGKGRKEGRKGEKRQARRSLHVSLLQ